MIQMGVYIPVWGRRKTFSVVVRHWEHVREKLSGAVDVLPFAVVSPGDPDPYPTGELSSKGWGVITVPNHPFGKKMNGGWRPMREAMPGDDVCFMLAASDNLVSETFIWQAIGQIHKPSNRSGFDTVAIDQCIFYDLETGKAAVVPASNRVDKNGSLGMNTGRLMSLRFLDAVDWNPYPKAVRKVDPQLLNSLRKAGATCHILPANSFRHVVNIKDDDALNPWEPARSNRVRRGQWKVLGDGLVKSLYPHLEELI